ncbi:saccharopine dehydrogenase NADP-binding domain-containing protein [Patulibacter sp. SYSU D01012]|uniref:saccharopine dehydrogenase family protein n=1 Tax=Patulibacter sp. SYSU D01012 TaxID=2817381 RepID=UPI001B30C9FE
MTAAPVVVYGATGYTGRLVCAELARRGVPVVASGRSPQRLAAVVDALPGADVRTVPAALDDPAALRRVASSAPVLANCAGPFVRTGDPVLGAAIAARAHYLDTTGEQAWIRRVLDDHDPALRAAGVAAVPGMGFDYLPGDLLCHLVGAPIAPLRRLEVGYHVDGFGMTRGTQRSALEMLDGRDVAYEDGRWRRGGRRPTRASIVFPGGVGRRRVARYPSGEVATVPRHVATREVAARISTVSVAPPALAGALPVLAPALSLLLRTPLTRLLDRAIDRLPEGPTEQARRAARWTIVARAEGEDGRVRRGTVRGPDVYGLTARLIADGAQRLADPAYDRRGGLAPAQAFDPRATLDGLADFGIAWSVEDAG